MDSQLNAKLVDRLRGALPKIQEWIMEYIQANARYACAVASLSIPGLAQCYSGELLETTRVVIADSICYPPLDRFGLGEFKTLSEIPWSGITFNDIYFLRRDVEYPALHFHELVHVVQYRRLGIERFLWAYSVGIALHGYENSPLEKMAYDLQLEFEHGIYRRTLVTDIEGRSDAVWQQACLQAGGLSEPTQSF